MHTTATPQLTFDDIDDLLYFTRANEVPELQQTIAELAQKFQCQPKHVLEAAVDPESGNTVLHFCSANGFVDLLSSLLAQLSGSDGQGQGHGHGRTASLVNHGNKEGNTPLHWAAYNGHLAIVKLLVAAGADMWAKNSAGHLSMFEAERADKSEVVQYLLEAEAQAEAGGKEVESGVTEGQPSAEDVADVQEGIASSDGAQAGAEIDVDMEEPRPNT